MHALVASSGVASGGNGTANAGPVYRWPALSSPSSMSDEDAEPDTDFGNVMKFKVDGRNSRNGRNGVAQSGRPAPLASYADAAASLQSAFCRRALGQPLKNHGTTAANEEKHDFGALDGNDSSDDGGLETKCSVQNLLDDSRNVFGDDADFLVDSPPTMIKCELASFNASSSLQLNQSCMYFDCASPSATPTSAAPTSRNTCSPPGTTTGDASQLDIYRDLILRHLIQDIKSTCAKLLLPTDPQQWSAEQSGRWITEMASQFQLAAAPRQLCLAGRALCAMNQDEFLARAPCGGDTLHAQLQLWKTATETCHQGQSEASSGANDSKVQNICRPNAAGSEHLGQLSLTDFLTNFNPSTGDATPSISSQHLQHGNGACGESLLLHTQHQQQHLQQQQQHHHQMLYFRSQHGTFQRSSQSHQQHLLPSPANSDPSDSGISADSYNDDDGEMKHMQQHGNGSGQPSALLPPHHLLGHHVMSAQAMTPICTGPPVSLVTPTGNIHLWQFIRELLDNPVQFSACVRWLDRKEGIFKIESSHQLARLWGQRKNRTKMNYDKLSRSLRQYYKKNIIKKTGQKQRLIYQFIPPYHFA